jgi:cellulose synthase/poly-beta-1,6-N-acetylglucosamine synthase-like glycosyltransferase
MEISLYLSALALALVIFNSLTIRVIKNTPTKVSGSVSVLIPMRNEEENVKGCLSSVLAQKGLDTLEVVAIDDGSTDNTSNEVKAFPSVELISGEKLPDKWLGKLWACQQLAEKSSGDYLVFVDADVRLSDYAVANSISKMGNWDFISPYPRQLTSGFVQKIFQPLLQWSWLSSVPLLIAQKYSIKSMAVANGQFLIFRRDAYFKSGAHAGIKTEVLDDLMLARNLLKQGYKGGVAEASKIATCHMYKNKMELFKGYQKSLWKAFGSVPGTILAIALLIVTGILPIISTALGSTSGLAAFGLITLSRMISSLRTGSLPNSAIFHPLAILMLLGLILFSWYGKITNTITWRDRTVI